MVSYILDTIYSGPLGRPVGQQLIILAKKGRGGEGRRGVLEIGCTALAKREAPAQVAHRWI